LESRRLDIQRHQRGDVLGRKLHETRRRRGNTRRDHRHERTSKDRIPDTGLKSKTRMEPVGSTLPMELRPQRLLQRSESARTPQKEAQTRVNAASGRMFQPPSPNPALKSARARPLRAFGAKGTRDEWVHSLTKPHGARVAPAARHGTDSEPCPKTFMDGGGIQATISREWQTESMTRVHTWLAWQRERRQTLAQRQQERNEDHTRSTDGTPCAEAAEASTAPEPTQKRRRDETATNTSAQPTRTAARQERYTSNATP